MNYENQLIAMIKNSGGLILSSQVDKASIPRIYLSILVKKGTLENIARGVYLTSEAIDDEMFRFQSRYSKGIFSHGTALYLHDLTDRTPHRYTMTFPNNYHAKSLEEEGVTAFYVDKQNYKLGMIDHLSPFGRTIRIYDKERTICDLVRSRNRMESGILTEAVKRYTTLKYKDIHLLMQYATRFRVEKIMRQYVEVLL